MHRYLYGSICAVASNTCVSSAHNGTADVYDEQTAISQCNRKHMNEWKISRDCEGWQVHLAILGYNG